MSILLNVLVVLSMRLWLHPTDERAQQKDYLAQFKIIGQITGKIQDFQDIRMRPSGTCRGFVSLRETADTYLQYQSSGSAGKAIFGICSCNIQQAISA